MDRSEADRRTGIPLVALGASLWGTDAVFRRGLALELPSATVVMMEHLILAVLAVPFIARRRRAFYALTRGEWIALGVIGAGSSALATTLFTAAFRYGDPTTPLLLQKLQPLVAILGARLLLGERMLPRFVWFLGAGIAGAYLLAFPDPAAATVAQVVPALLAIGAAALWGMGTVLGRRLISTLDHWTLTAARFLIGLPASVVLMSIVDGWWGIAAIGWSELRALILLALVPGLLAILFYYAGLRATPASAATIAELAFPVTAAGLNYVVFGTVLSPSQAVGGVLLVATIAMMSYLARSSTERLGVIAEPIPAVV
jgi:drug/metabolite transporter (DMT)-like permease